MTVCCQHCRRALGQGVPVSGCQQQDSRRYRHTAIMDRPFRSTKGASKARRDQMNAEIRKLREVLPVPEEDKDRLSYLHTMALVCLWIRGPRLCPGATEGMAEVNLPPPALDPLLSLPGFIIAFSADGKFISISDNIRDFLGYTVVDLVAQGDSFFHLIDVSEVSVVQEKLQKAGEVPGTETTFVCHLQSEKMIRMKYGGKRAVLVRGRFLPAPPQTAPIFIAFCTPLVHGPEEGWLSHNASFQSQHTLDMKLTAVTESVDHHIGYHRKELIGRSWYSLLHPGDLSFALAQHKELLMDAGAGDVKSVVRMLSRELSYLWVQVIATRDKQGETITCTNRILSEAEASYLAQRDLSSGDDTLRDTCSVMGGPDTHRRREPCTQDILLGTHKRKMSFGSSGEPESKHRRVLQNSSCVPPRGSTYELQLTDTHPDASFLFTPPYTPESDTGSLLGFDGSVSPSSDMAAFHADSWDLPAEYQLGRDTLSSPYFPDILAGQLTPVESIAMPAGPDTAFPMPTTYSLPELSPAKEDLGSEDISAFSSPGCLTLVPDPLLSPEEEDMLLAESDFYPHISSIQEAFLFSPEGQDIPAAFSITHDAFPAPVGVLSRDTSLPNTDDAPPSSGGPQYMEHEWQEISLLATQLSAMVESFSGYLRSTHKGIQAGCSSTSNGGWESPIERLTQDTEPVLDERVIASILQDLCSEKGGPSPPGGAEVGGGPFTMSTSPGPLQADYPGGSLLPHALTALMSPDACVPESPQNSYTYELYQLEHPLHITLQHGGEESMF